jgi:hypothetical protein
MRELSPEEFVLRAVQVLPSDGSEHAGLRKRDLDTPFRLHFGAGGDLDEILNALITEGKIIAIHLTWTQRPKKVEWEWRPKPLEVQRLSSFPDPDINDSDPILYLRNNVPARFQSRVFKTEMALKKILDD